MSCSQATGPDGGLTLACRECDRAGYQPFAQPGSHGALEFWTAPTPDMPQGIPALTVRSVATRNWLP